MPKFVKWFVNLYPQEDAYARELTKAAGLRKDVETVRGLIEYAMKQDQQKIIEFLKQSKVEAKDRALQDQIKALERKRQELARERAAAK